MAKQLSLSEALARLQEKEAKALVQKKLKAGAKATEVLAECQEGLAEVGRRFQTGEYFISELIYAGEIMKGITAQLGPKLRKARGRKGKGTIVLGTVKGDIHDIGKDVVALMLRGAGYEVVDLGVDVSSAKFVEAVQKRKAFALGMSVFLTTCCKAIEETVAALKAAGLREKVNVMIGGAAASDFVAERTGCDAFGATAVDAVSIAAAAAQ